MDQKDYLSLVARDDVKIIVFHDEAINTINEMHARVDTLETYFGAVHPVFINARRSLHDCLRNIYRSSWGGTSYVTKDSELCLLVQNSTFVFGIIFHPDRADYGEGRNDIAGQWSSHS